MNEYFYHIKQSDLFNKESIYLEPILLNFPVKNSIKVVQYFNKIDKISIEKYCKEIVLEISIYKEQIILEEIPEKFLISCLSIIENNNILIANTAGLTFETIEFASFLLNKIAKKLNKIIILIS